MHEAYIVELKELRKHNNADRLQIATVFGNNVVVSLDYKVGDFCIYFPSDLQLGQEYAEANDLLRRKDENGNDVGGYLDPDKRKITAIRLRGENSDGLLMPITSLECLGDISDLKPGDRLSTFNGKALCNKYIPKAREKNRTSRANPKKKIRENHFPTFYRHIDTEQLAYNLGQIKFNDILIFTDKLHGTSGRTGYLPKVTKIKPKWYQRLLGKKEKEVRNYEYISGSRKVVLEDMSQEGYYGSNDFRAKWHDFFKDKLEKGETVYYEIVGAASPGVPIMPSADNKALGDKDFVKRYGKVTNFTYGCDIEKGENAIYVYRMTMTNEDGYVVDYPWDLVKARCEQMNVEYVPELGTLIVKLPIREEIILEKANIRASGPDLIDPTHIREGCVVRIASSPTFKAFKHKSHEFKVLAGIAAAKAEDSDADADLLSEM